MGKVIPLKQNDVDWLLGELLQQCREDNIKGLLVQALYADGNVMIARAGDITYLEHLGLLEVAKQHGVYSAGDS